MRKIAGILLCPCHAAHPLHDNPVIIAARNFRAACNAKDALWKEYQAVRAECKYDIEMSPEVVAWFEAQNLTL